MLVSMVNLRGRYRFNVTPLFPRWQGFLLATLIWMSIYVAAVLFSHRCPERFRQIPPDLRRLCIRAFLPLFGLILTVAKLMALNWWGSIDIRPFVYWAASIVPLCLLGRALDTQRPFPIPLRPSVAWAALAAASFYAVLHLTPYGAFDQPGYYWLGCCASTVLGVFAVTPAIPFIRRACKEPLAVVVAGIAMAAPLIPFAWKLTLWEHMALPTANLVSLLLGMVGISTTTRLGTKANDDGSVTDYHGYVSSNDFSVQIGSWCGGYEGIAMFLFLLGFFLLLDWHRFASIRNLWALLPATIVYVLLVNVIRITALFIYAEIIIAEDGHGEATRATVDAFHSYAGLVLYTIAFWPFMACVYQWESRHARRAQQHCRSKEIVQ